MSNQEPENKRKKPNYYMQKKRKQFVIEPGLKGFLCTCNFREKECVRESYNLLNFYVKDSDQSTRTGIAEKTDEKSNNESDEDIADELSKEINKEKTMSQRQFQYIDTGAKNILFIRTTIDNPVKLTLKIIEDILQSQKQRTRYLLRLVPIEITCKATLEEIKTSAIILIDQYFSGEPTTFAIAFNHRNNNTIKRDEVIKQVALLISAKNPKHVVNLTNAHYTMIIEIIKGFCFISVLPDYSKYKKYNLLQLAEISEKKADIVESENANTTEDTANKNELQD